MELTTKKLSDYLDILVRRKSYVLLVWAIVTVAAVVFAYNLPKTFKATAVMLMQSSMPAKITETNGGIFADEQIQTIYQKVLTTKNILSIVQDNGLYSDVAENMTTDELVAAFKESLVVELATSALLNNNSKLSDIIFNISFNYIDPVKAKKVVDDVGKHFIELNDQQRANAVGKVTDFLMEEMERLNLKRQETDNKIVVFKEQHINSLPEHLQNNVSTIERTENELRDTENQIRSTKDKLAFVEAELVRAKEEYPRSANADAPKSKEETLSILQEKYAKLSTIYSPSHPDIIRLKHEITALNGVLDLEPQQEKLIKRISDLKLEIASLSKSYTDNHPELAKRKLELNKLESQLNDEKSRSSHKLTNTVRSSNPALINLEIQYKNSQSELQTLLEKQNYLKAKLDNVKSALTVSPKIESEYSELVRERDSTLKKYNQIREKWLDAQLMQTMETQQQGQSLTLLEPANLPTKPEKAIRKKIAIGGFFAGLLGGLGLALLVELNDPVIRGYRSVIETTGLMPIIVIPYIDSFSEEANKLVKQKKVIRFKIWLIIGQIILALGLLSFMAFKLGLINVIN